VAAALGIDVGDLLDLSQSLNPFAPDPSPIVARHLDALGRYPDPTAATAALADAMGVEGDRLLLTNGGAEAIALVAAELGRGRVDEPDFALYARHLELDPAGPLVRSNPHSPSGLLARPDQRAAVWDEAFYPLATGSWTRGDPDTLVVGSLTKLLACPGLRLGYVLAPSAAELAPIAARQPGWSVNGLAAAALPELLDAVDLGGWCAGIAAARRNLVELLATYDLIARPSDAPWVLVDVPELAHLGDGPGGPEARDPGGPMGTGTTRNDAGAAGGPDAPRGPASSGRPAPSRDEGAGTSGAIDTAGTAPSGAEGAAAVPTTSGPAARLREALARHGVLVRDCSSFGLPGVVRIAVAAPAGLERLARALDQVVPSSARRPEAGPSAESAP
jgi:histidinol-phosphate/aromatic aminotransferase/cobyric acid decarboxylase-like protein